MMKTTTIASIKLEVLKLEKKAANLKLFLVKSKVQVTWTLFELSLSDEHLNKNN